MFSISPLENAEYKGKCGIYWELRAANAKMLCVTRLSYLENHRYMVTRGIYWEICGLIC